jgi:ketosteroid isomerase-like protein
MLLAVALTAAPVPARAAGDGFPPDLAQAWADYDQATVRKDVARLAALVTDDYVLVNSDSSVQDKASYLADFNVPDFKLEPYEIEQPLRRAWGNTALTGGVFSLGWTQGGQHHQRRLRIAHIWSRQEGRWRIAYTQLTRIPD